MLTLATKAAKKAGELLMDSFGRASLKVESKGGSDFVTEVDHAAEELICETIKSEYPGHGFLLEEGGTIEGDGHYLWVVDPLDGTTNYVHRFPFFAVSIALLVDGEPALGVVYDPLRNELFSAERGEGTMLNGVGVHVSDSEVLGEAVIATGFPFRVRQHLDTYLGIFRDIFDRTAGMRRAGSASLDLAYVAAGRVDGFWELGLRPWDVAAGSLLVTEAGGRVTDFLGGGGAIDGGDIVASNGTLQDELVSCTRGRCAGGRPQR